MNKVLVTGGAGFIGTHLCRALVQAGYQVRVIDLVKPKIAIDQVEYIQGNVCDQAVLEQVVEGVDAVYHFAALVSVPLCTKKPIESYQTNLLATCKVLDAIRKEIDATARKIRFIFAGSSVVYGNNGAEGKARNEDELLDSPLSIYGAQKLASEHAIQLFHKQYNIPAVIFRFFNVYGPGQDPDSPYSGVISIFANALRESRPISLNAGGHQTRDFVSVHDLMLANIRALEVDESKCDAKPINLGTGQSVSIRTLANKMLKLSGKRVSLVEAPARPGDVLHSLASIERAQAVLGWKPQIKLAEGMSEILNA